MGRYGLLVWAVAVSMGCDSGSAPSLYDPDRASLPDPVIESVTPERSALAGVDVVTLSGNNFASIAGHNLVYFGDTRADLLDASPTQLRVRPPNTPLPEVLIRVSVLGAEHFSNAVPYALEAPVTDFGNLTPFEEIFGITSDRSGNVYVSLFYDSRSQGIIQMTPEGERSVWVTTNFGWTDLAFGSDGYLYAARGVRALFRFEEGGSQQAWVVLPSSNEQLLTLAIADNGFIWTAGRTSAVHGVAPDLAVRSYAFDATVRDLIIHDRYLYAVGESSGESKLWRFSIGANDELGASEEVVNLTALNGRTGMALAATVDSYLFIGTDAADPVLQVNPDGSTEPFYPGVLVPPASDFAWGQQGYLYMVADKTLDTDAALYRVNTRRMGAQ